MYLGELEGEEHMSSWTGSDFGHYKRHEKGRGQNYRELKRQRRTALVLQSNLLFRKYV